MATIVRRGESWQAKIRLRGQRPRTRTFKRKTDALLWAKKVESDLGHGTYVPTTADRRRTLQELIEKYVTEWLPQLKSSDTRNVEARLNWWKENAGYLTLDKLTPQVIAGYKPELLARRTSNGKAITPATANRYLAALSAVCKWAWKELGYLPANPVLGVTKGAEHKGIVRYLSDDERKALLAACRASDDPNVYCAVMLALSTGARYSNIRNLTWADVDLAQWRLRFVATKNKQPRFVPVVGLAKAVLQAQYDRDPTKKGWVFKGASDRAPADIDRPWRVVRAAAGLTGDASCRFHDLRHTTASYLTMNGATLAEVAEALGHRTLLMAKRYSHQSGEHVRSTLERMAARFLDDEGLTGPADPGKAGNAGA